MIDTPAFEPPAWPDGTRWLVDLPAAWSGEKKGSVFEFRHISGKQSLVLGVSKAIGVAERTPAEDCLNQANTEFFGALYASLPKSLQLRAARLINPVFLFTARHASLGQLLGRMWCWFVRAQINQRSFGVLTGYVVQRFVGQKFVASGYLRAMEWRFWVSYVATAGSETLTHGSANDVLSAIRFQGPNAL